MTKPLMSEDAFRAAAKAATATPGVLIDGRLRKAFAAEVIKADGAGDRTLDFVISTASVDRMGDTIAVDGWQLEAYRKNPVVLWAHDSSSLPVAKASSVRLEEGKLKAQAEFATKEISPFADSCFQMYKAGFLSAVSVGFIPLKYAFVDDPERRYGIDFLEQELLEFSCCPVPANAEALVEARAAGIDTAPLLSWAKGVIQREGPATPVLAEAPWMIDILRRQNAAAGRRFRI